MVRAAAKEPAIVALAKAFLEFIGVSFPWRVGRYGSTTWIKLSPSVEAADGGRAHGDPSIAVTHVPAVELPVTSSQSCDGNKIFNKHQI
jgi:hypothetical protein